MNKRIGFPCKWIDRADQVDAIKSTDDCKKYTTGTTTVSWLNRQNQDVAVSKLWELLKSNIESARLLVNRVGGLDHYLRMVRLGSDMLPAYTHENWSWFWKQSDVRTYCEKAFGEVGRAAREKDVRLSFHPGQFTVLASENDNIVARSIEEFEYHADMARWMGYGKTFQDFKINVHISGRRGPAGIKEVIPRLSVEARNCLTIENDENSWGIEDSIELSKHCALVLDIHHHWIRTGEYIRPNDDRCLRVIESWRGVRPVIHYSLSREYVLPGHCNLTMPDMASLIVEGKNKQKLRAHSDFYWNNAVNQWAASFSNEFDIMCESKAKNLASFAFAKVVMDT